MFNATLSLEITRTTPFEQLPEYLSPDEARAFLDVGRSMIYEMIRSGELEHRRFGRIIRIPKAALR